MGKKFTVQCLYAAYLSSVVTVEGETFENALDIAIQKANDEALWKTLDDVGDTFVAAACEGETHDPWTDDRLTIPEKYTEVATLAANAQHENAALLSAAPAMRTALMAIQRQRARDKPIRGHEMDLVTEALRLVPGTLTEVLDSIHPRPDWEYE